MIHDLICFRLTAACMIVVILVSCDRNGDSTKSIHLPSHSKGCRIRIEHLKRFGSPKYGVQKAPYTLVNFLTPAHGDIYRIRGPFLDTLLSMKAHWEYGGGNETYFRFPEACAGVYVVELNEREILQIRVSPSAPTYYSIRNIYDTLILVGVGDEIGLSR
jgi:hypothetical protein